MNNNFRNYDQDPGRFGPHLFSYEEVEAMLPAYVLGALEPEEMLLVDEYIQQHLALFRQLERLEQTSASLALAVPEVTPPLRVKNQLMARVYQDQQRYQPAQPELRTQLPPPAMASTPEAVSRLDKPAVSLRERLRHWLGGTLLWPALTAVSTAVALLMVIYAAQIWGRLNTVTAQIEQTQQTLAQVQAQNESLQSLNASLQQRVQESENQLALFANANQVVTLEGTEEAPQASGAFYASRETSVLVMRGLLPLGPDQTYELWLIPEQGDPVPAGLVQVDDSGNATATISMVEQPVEFAAVGVSIEPQQGSPQPTGPIVLLGTVKG